MSTLSPFPDLIAAARSRAGLAPLLGALGFDPARDEVPPEAWPAWGLAGASGLQALVVVGRCGSLEALLLETADPGGAERVAALARRIHASNPARSHLFVAASSGYRRLVLGTFGLDDAFRHLTLEPEGFRPSDLEALEEMVPRNGERGLELAVRQARALDRSRVTRAFFRDFRVRRGAVAEAWIGLPAGAARERAQLALLFLSRLTFLYFLQRRGALAGDDRYLVRLLGAWAMDARTRPGPAAGEPPPGTGVGGTRPTFFRARLQPLFFGALNRRPDDRDVAARRLGDLPYLNGGLFDRHTLERRFPELDLPDPEVRACFDHLLERYRFTDREGGDPGFGVDPEILGRVFEGLMAPEARSDTGSFYTPAPVVRRVLREAVAAYVSGTAAPEQCRAVTDGQGATLPAPVRHRVRRELQRVRVLDPACGSGAFLLGALERLSTAIAGLEEAPRADVRRDVVARSLHGVDLLDDAALLCSLRLWLALSEGEDRIRPLPNLDRRIRQGDALVDPLDLGALGPGDSLRWRPSMDPEVRRALRALGPAAEGYLQSGPEDRDEARARIQDAELRLARHWVHGLRGARRQQLRRLAAAASERDLFGLTPDSARKAASEALRVEERLRELDRVARRLDEDGALPFFSFGVHFAEAADGFDLIVSNPPWVRIHRWPDHLRSLAHRFEVVRGPGWTAAALTGAPAAGGRQVDLSLLFIERAVRLLAPGGVLAVVLSAKTFRALYGGATRRMLLRDLEFVLIEDHALDTDGMFNADAFAAILVGRRPGPGSTPRPERHVVPGGLRVRMTRAGVEPLEFRLDPAQLPVLTEETASPWLLVPPEVGAVLRRMQAAGPPLGATAGLRVRRGVMTGANDVLVFRAVEPGLGGLARVEAQGLRRARRSGESAAETGRYRAIVETAGVRPLVRGADVDAFRWEPGGHIAWCHGPDARPVRPGPRLGAYLERHRQRLEARSGWRPGLPLGAIFRLAPETLGHKVAWHDLSDTLRAVALPPAAPFDGADRELVPLNTVYFLPTPDRSTAVLLAGLLNSLPIRTMARAVAERAKDARFRFFAWTVSLLPLPPAWRDHDAATDITAISERAHRERGIAPGQQTRLDRAVASLFGLGPDDMDILASFDAWLRGEP